MKAIVYTSHTGFTQRYAQMLAEQTQLSAYSLTQAQSALGQGDEIVFLGWLCAGGVNGLAKAMKRYDVRGVCAVGMAPPGGNDVNELVKRNHLDARPVFYLQGGYAPQKLRGVYKPMMWMMGKMVAKRPVKSEKDREMQQAFVQGGDWASAQQLAPVLDWLGAQP